MRPLGAGVTVSRTAGDLVRYHGKLVLVDRQELFLLAFNFTYLDIEQSRSFGIVTTWPQHVEEAARLFEADSQRTPYAPGSETFLVSPVNARKHLAAFIEGAKKEQIIYDPEISDPAMIAVLDAQMTAGVAMKIIGGLAGQCLSPRSRKLTRMRLHTRAIIRDGERAFVGSQSLRALELDARREVGLIFDDTAAIERLKMTFHEDWDSKDSVDEFPGVEKPGSRDNAADAEKVAKKVAKTGAQDLQPIAPVVETAVNDVASGDTPVELNSSEIEATVRSAVKDAVREVVRGFVEDAKESGTPEAAR